MSKSDAFETLLLQHVFQNAAMPQIGGNTAAYDLPVATTAGVLRVSLHVGDPGEAGSPTTNLVGVGYVDYAPQTVVRTASGWTVSGNQVSNAAVISFPVAGAASTSVTITHIGISTAGTTPILLYKGALSSSLVVNAGITPQFAVNALVITED